MNTLTSEPYVACERCCQMMPPSDLHPCGPGGRWRYCGRCINEAEARPTDTVIRTSNERLPKLCDYPGCCVSTFNAYCERHQPTPPDYLLDAEIQAQGIEGMTHEIKRLRAENSRLWLLKRGSPETREQLAKRLIREMRTETESENTHETFDGPTPHHVRYDRSGWLCSVCGGWNDMHVVCQHPHALKATA